MKDDLKNALTSYYDFLVAYQNLLRDGGTFNQVTIQSEDNKLALNNWPARQGEIATVCKKTGNRQVVHLINFKDSKTSEWKDNKGIQAVPAQIDDIKLVLTSNGTVKNIWTATPDVMGGASRPLNFIQNKNEVHFVLPELKYWSMIVFEYE